MALIVWREEYVTGISEMDQQHKVLLEMINDLYEIVRDRKGDDALSDIVAKLSGYCQEHLDREESLLEEYSYPGLDEQRKNHGEFTDKLATLTAQMEADKETMAPEVYKFLRHWWLGHIVSIDKHYGPFLNKKGVN